MFFRTIIFLEPTIRTTTTIITPTINGNCPSYTGSGLFSSGKETRIIRGNDAKPRDLPWQVLFDNKDCGGTLVSLQVTTL